MRTRYVAFVVGLWFMVGVRAAWALTGIAAAEPQVAAILEKLRDSYLEDCRRAREARDAFMKFIPSVRTALSSRRRGPARVDEIERLGVLQDRLEKFLDVAGEVETALRTKADSLFPYERRLRRKFPAMRRLISRYFRDMRKLRGEYTGMCRYVKRQASQSLRSIERRLARLRKEREELAAGRAQEAVRLHQPPSAAGSSATRGEGGASAMPAAERVPRSSGEGVEREYESFFASAPDDLGMEANPPIREADVEEDAGASAGGGQMPPLFVDPAELGGSAGAASGASSSRSAPKSPPGRSKSEKKSEGKREASSAAARRTGAAGKGRSASGSARRKTGAGKKNGGASSADRGLQRGGEEDDEEFSFDLEDEATADAAAKQGGAERGAARSSAADGGSPSGDAGAGQKKSSSDDEEEDDDMDFDF